MCYSTQTQTFSPTKYPLSPQHHDALADQWFVCWPIIELRPHLVCQAARAHPIGLASMNASPPICRSSSPAGWGSVRACPKGR